MPELVSDNRSTFLDFNMTNIQQPKLAIISSGRNIYKDGKITLGRED